MEFDRLFNLTSTLLDISNPDNKLQKWHVSFFWTKQSTNFYQIFDLRERTRQKNSSPSKKWIKNHVSNTQTRKLLSFQLVKTKNVRNLTEKKFFSLRTGLITAGKWQVCQSVHSFFSATRNCSTQTFWTHTPGLPLMFSYSEWMDIWDSLITKGLCVERSAVLRVWLLWTSVVFTWGHCTHCTVVFLYDQYCMLKSGRQ